jgi:trigger factor
MTFELHIEVRPDVALDKVSGFTVTRPSAAVTDADVDAQLERLRDQRATWAPKEGKADPGDLVTVDLSASEADGSFPEPREYQITIGEGQAIPGVEELVLETAPGETTERPVKWPEDFPDESLRGVTKTVRVTVKAVKRKEAPMLDDDFAKSVGDFETIDALRAQVRADLERHARQEADASLRTALLDQVLAEKPFDHPPSWVGELVARYVEAYQVPETERDRFAEEFKPVAERQVRRDVVIELLAERHGLVPGEADVDEKVAQLAKQRGVNVGELYASLQKAGRIPVLEREIMEDRVFGWLLDRNTVVES